MAIEGEDLFKPKRMGHLIARKTRIERWAYQSSRSASSKDRDSTTSLSLQNPVTQKRSESLFSQNDRKLRMHLLQLSDQRQKVIDHHNFDQKTFANKQALKHKDNPHITRTLSYVRKCCKYVDEAETEENAIDPKIFLEENSARRRSRSRSPSVSSRRSISRQSSLQTAQTLTETFIQHNRKHIESLRSTPVQRKNAESRTSTETPTIDDETQKRHVQFRINPERERFDKAEENDQLFKKAMPRNTISALGICSQSTLVKCQTRPTNSAPLIRTFEPTNDENQIEEKAPIERKRRSISKIRSPVNALKEFRLHPERYLSPSNRYLPLLRQQAREAEHKASILKEQQEKTESLRRRFLLAFSPSRMSDGSDMTYDDAKSFLSEETDFGRNINVETEKKSPSKAVSANKTNDNEDPSEKNSNEREILFERLREREIAHFNNLIKSNSIEPVLEVLSPMNDDQIDEKSKRDGNENLFGKTKQKKSISLFVQRRALEEIVEEIDSLKCADINDRRARRKVDLEKNRAKLGILIF